MIRLSPLPCLLLALLAGCQTTPMGYERIAAVVKPKGRGVAVLPFKPKGPGATQTDGVILAELAARRLHTALPDLNVIGPRAILELHKGAINEAQLPLIAQKAQAKLLVTGDIGYLTTRFRNASQSRHGTIAIQFLVRELGAANTTKPAAKVNWSFAFPLAEDAFDPKYVHMNAKQFRLEMLKYTAQQVAGLFYDHLRRKRPTSHREVRVFTEPW